MGISHLVLVRAVSEETLENAWKLSVPAQRASRRSVRVTCARGVRDRDSSRWRSSR